MSSAEQAPPWPIWLPPHELLEVPGERRREAGRLHFTEALQQLLRRVSHPQLSELADWACNERGNLHTSQISHLRNNKLQILGMKCADALGRINQAAWVVQQLPELLPQLGTAELTPRIEAILASYEPLLDPVSSAPLGASQFLALYLGYLELPLERPLVLTPEQATLLAERIGVWLDQQLTAKGLGFREAGRRLQRAWSDEGNGGDGPASSSAGAAKLLRVINGLDDYSPRQLIEDWPRIAQAATAVLELDLDARQLASELLAAPIAAT
jgi:hypothetical protein